MNVIFNNSSQNLTSTRSNTSPHSNFAKSADTVNNSKQFNLIYPHGFVDSPHDNCIGLPITPHNFGINACNVFNAFSNIGCIIFLSGSGDTRPNIQAIAAPGSKVVALEAISTTCINT